MTGHVVVGVDGSPRALAAVRWAAGDATLRQRRLRVVHVTEPWIFDQPLATPPGFHDSVGENSATLLAEAADAARERAPGLHVETATLPGDVRKVLLEQSRDAEELVVGSRGLGGFLGMVLGSVSMGVSGHAACPVVVVGHLQDTPRGEIAVGHDGSPGSEGALEYAFEEADLRGARLRAVYAWQVTVVVPVFAGYALDLEKLYDFGKRTAREQLRPWREKYPQVDVRATVVCAHPVEALSEASSQAELVVVGSRGRSGLGSVMLGSVTHGVLHHAYCPVAVVRSGHPSPVSAQGEHLSPRPEGGGSFGS